MVFSSITFMFFFLPAVVLLYYIVPSLKARNALLLLASLLFYTWGEPHYVVIMLFSIAINYLFGRLIGYSADCQDAPPPVLSTNKINIR